MVRAYPPERRSRAGCHTPLLILTNPRLNSLSRLNRLNYLEGIPPPILRVCLFPMVTQNRSFAKFFFLINDYDVCTVANIILPYGNNPVSLFNPGQYFYIIAFPEAKNNFCLKCLCLYTKTNIFNLQ